jgi:hypothetical protein
LSKYVKKETEVGATFFPPFLSSKDSTVYCLPYVSLTPSSLFITSDAKKETETEGDIRRGGRGKGRGWRERRGGEEEGEERREEERQRRGGGRGGRKEDREKEGEKGEKRKGR